MNKLNKSGSEDEVSLVTGTSFHHASPVFLTKCLLTFENKLIEKAEKHCDMLSS